MEHLGRARAALGAAGLALGVGTAGCGSDDDPARWAGTVDTLETGVVIVTSPAVGLWDSAEAWRLREDLRIGALEGDDYASFAQIIDIEVDADGRIYVLDRQLREIRVFDAAGDYVRTIGRPGEGPGEFIEADGMTFAPSGDLWVMDNNRPYYSVFDSTGSFARTHRRTVTRYGYGWPGGFTHAGALYDRTGIRDAEGSHTVLVRYDTARGFVDTTRLPEIEQAFYDLRDPRTRIGTIAQVPFTGRLTWRLDPRGYIWAGFSGEYRIYRLSLAGDTLVGVGRDFDAIPVWARERREALEAIRRAAQGRGFDPDRIPGHKPPWQTFVVDDAGYLWVMTTPRDETAGTTFDVFGPDSRFLGPVRAEVRVPRFVPIAIREGALYTVVTDEFDVPYVVRLRIDGR